MVVHTLSLADCKLGDTRVFEKLVLGKVSMKRLEDKYHVKGKKLAGKGSYGTVHRVNGKDGRRYAIKQLTKPLDCIRWKAIFTEIEVLAGNRHENLIKLCDLTIHNDTINLVTEHAKGKTLQQHAATRPMSEKSTATIGHQVLLALVFLHAKGILHGDVKPENIMVYETGCHSCGSHYQVKLLDFGSSKLPEDDEELGSSGTGLYLALEVIEGLLQPGKTRYGRKPLRSDMFSLGVVLFICLCRFHPFRGTAVDTLEGMREKLSRGADFPADIFLSELCRRFLILLLKLDPLDRLSAAEAVQNPWIEGRLNNPHHPASPEGVPQCNCGSRVYSAPEDRFPSVLDSSVESLSSLTPSLV
eukprot:TRINITY_DN3600_c0_g1_i1.p1 TRINITY_DN3600_c0_g1~~TRINITY_DN3600_c0_g1_i1.p1  ORF type:complete len:358 (+),score=24.89 TRINITY_DN3600_c0_g1_i1:84-1157(+)